MFDLMKWIDERKAIWQQYGLALPVDAARENEYIKKITKHDIDLIQAIVDHTLANGIPGPNTSTLVREAPAVRATSLSTPLTYQELEDQNDRIVQANSDLITENTKLKQQLTDLKVEESKRERSQDAEIERLQKLHADAMDANDKWQERFAQLQTELAELHAEKKRSEEANAAAEKAIGDLAVLKQSLLDAGDYERAAKLRDAMNALAGKVPPDVPPEIDLAP